jgi:hypothetical protein
MGDASFHVGRDLWQLCRDGWLAATSGDAAENAAATGVRRDRWLARMGQGMSEHVDKVRLYTGDGEYVVSVEIPHVEPRPRVLEWGKRYFVQGNGMEYVEATCYAITGNVTDEGEVKDINVT